MEHGFQEAGQEEPSQHNDDNTEISMDDDLPLMVGRPQNDDSSDDSSKGIYVYHTDHSESSFESSNDERSSSKTSLQQCSGRCSDEIPLSIDIHSCNPSWKIATVNEDEDDADQDDDAESIAPLRMRGGGNPVVETVKDDDTEEGDDNQQQSQPTQNPLIPTLLNKIQPTKTQNMTQ